MPSSLSVSQLLLNTVRQRMLTLYMGRMWDAHANRRKRGRCSMLLQLQTLSEKIQYSLGTIDRLIIIYICLNVHSMLWEHVTLSIFKKKKKKGKTTLISRQLGGRITFDKRYLFSHGTR